MAKLVVENLAEMPYAAQEIAKYQMHQPDRAEFISLVSLLECYALEIRELQQKCVDLHNMIMEAK